MSAVSGRAADSATPGSAQEHSHPITQDEVDTRTSVREDLGYEHPITDLGRGNIGDLDPNNTSIGSGAFIIENNSQQPFPHHAGEPPDPTTIFSRTTT
ncbi:hypothetical protein Vi05172_g7355 [Venturia inaequalis]|nr:hypothetical protein Vi05172_g7355 [Venturia inaequalis]